MAFGAVFGCRNSRTQYTTIPNCESVKARNAPTAYSGMSLSVIPLNAISSSPAQAAKNSTPTEFTSLRPIAANPAGRNPSLAISRQSRGKSTKLVFADRHSTASTLEMVIL